MKTKLSLLETLSIASLLFGLFFGAGNLIFPISLGQQTGAVVYWAILGFLITGVGLPLLGVVCLGTSQANGLLDLASRVSTKFGLFFTCILYLTIGPFFAIPRCASVSYTIGVEHLVPGVDPVLALGIFSFIFFALVLFFSLRPQDILTWIGKVLNPLFLAFLSVFIVKALFSAVGDLSMAATNVSALDALGKGFVGGYDTMDALAGLAFGIIVVQAVRSMGVKKPMDVAKQTLFAGSLGALLMALIYALLTVIGAKSLSFMTASSNGGEALAMIADYYFGQIGAWLLAFMVSLACLKTAVGLVTSCAETFVSIFKHGPSYRIWAIGFTLISFLIANLGLNAILLWSSPVLMFLYPLAIVLIILSLLSRFLHPFSVISCWTIGATMIAAGLDFLVALPKFGDFSFASWLFWHSSYAWVIFACVGLLIGYLRGRHLSVN